jgi:hypothetical protein
MDLLSTSHRHASQGFYSAIQQTAIIPFDHAFDTTFEISSIPSGAHQESLREQVALKRDLFSDCSLQPLTKESCYFIRALLKNNSPFDVDVYTCALELEVTTLKIDSSSLLTFDSKTLPINSGA